MSYTQPASQAATRRELPHLHHRRAQHEAGGGGKRGGTSGPGGLGVSEAASRPRRTRARRHAFLTIDTRTSRAEARIDLHRRRTQREAGGGENDNPGGPTGSQSSGVPLAASHPHRRPRGREARLPPSETRGSTDATSPPALAARGGWRRDIPVHGGAASGSPSAGANRRPPRTPPRGCKEARMPSR